MEEWYRKLDVIRAVNVGAISAAALYGRTDSGIATFKEILKAVENLQSADLEAAIVKVLKIVEEYKEKTGLDEILIMPKNGMKAWDENGVEYTMQPTCNNLATDTISRKAAIALAKDLCVTTKDGTEYRHRCIDPDAIKELPSAQPDLLKGAKCEIICSQRQTGRTTKLIEKCARYRYALIVCPSRMRANNIFHYARKMGIHIPMPMTFGDFLKGRFAAEHIDAFLIDDLDSCLANYSWNVPIDTVVFEGRAERREERKENGDSGKLD